MSECDLAGADLTGANLAGADMSEVWGAAIERDGLGAAERASFKKTKDMSAAINDVERWYRCLVARRKKLLSLVDVGVLDVECHPSCGDTTTDFGCRAHLLLTNLVVNALVGCNMTDTRMLVATAPMAIREMFKCDIQPTNLTAANLTGANLSGSVLIVVADDGRAVRDIFWSL